MASQDEIIQALETAQSDLYRLGILKKMENKLHPSHGKLIRYLVQCSLTQKNPEILLEIKRVLFLFRSREDIASIPLFLLDPVGLLSSQDPAWRFKALEICEKGSLSMEQQIFYLGALFKEEDPFVLSRMVKTLPEVLSSFQGRLREFLLPWLSHQDERVRANALEGLRQVKGERLELYQILMDCLKDPNHRVRKNAISQLVQFRQPVHLGALKKLIQSSKNYHELVSCRELLLSFDLDDQDEWLKILGKRIDDAHEEMLPPIDEDLAEESPEVHLDISEEPVARGWIWVFESFRFLRYRLFPTFFGVFVLVVLIFGGLFWPSGVQKKELPIAVMVKKQRSSPAQSVSTQSVRLPVPKEILKKQKEDIKDLDLEIWKDERLSIEDRLGWMKEYFQLRKRPVHEFLQIGEILENKGDFEQASRIYELLYQLHSDQELMVEIMRRFNGSRTVIQVLKEVEDASVQGMPTLARQKLSKIKDLVSDSFYQSWLLKIRLKTEK